MTETVRALCAWAKQQPGVWHITAETEPDNRASQRIQQRAGFHPAEADAAGGGACETGLSATREI